MSSSLGIRSLAWVLALLVVTLPLVGLFEGWFAASHWPVRSLRVDAAFRHIEASQVRAVAAPLLARGFFAVDLAALQKGVAALPWVGHVEVRKHWPDQVWITIREQHPFARWNTEELVNRHGGLFRVPEAARLDKLPQLGGPTGSETRVLKFFLDARHSFAAAGRTVTAARLSRRGSWSLQLDDGAIVVIGSVEPAQRLARFVESYRNLMAGHTQDFLSADLRYSNGYAVRWADPTRTDGGPPPT